MRDTTEEPRTPISASSAMSMGGRRVPLPAVKGTMGGIESPRRELFSPASTLRASTSPRVLDARRLHHHSNRGA
ncbi:hypothetical protein CcaverHIS641_0308700 [Cutaneotrichosporon cavernicola]|nr:hypothetical protein CcaverHIS641_0308700 [Cutaneotrichosporon cavernicola]